MNYILHVTENELTTSIVVTIKSIGPGMQVTTANKGSYAMVYVWDDCNTKLEEHRFDNHEDARNKAWEIARNIGRKAHQVKENSCNCGAQNRAEHRPHSNDCNVYK